MMNNPFAAIDSAFEAYKQENPNATFGEFSVWKQANYIRRGGAHATLGPKLAGDREWSTAGELTFSNFRSKFSIEAHHKVVDYGCGSLRVGVHFIRHLNRGNYFGLDVTTDFIDFGKELIGGDLLEQKAPRFAAINDESVREAKSFEADFIFATAVAFQVHPDDHATFLSNLGQLASKPGALLVFDTKLSDEHYRYRNSAWVWPLDTYRNALAPFGLQVVENMKIGEHEEVGRRFDAVRLSFRKR